MKRERKNPQDGPLQERRTYGAAKPERPRPQPDDTPDQQGIEIDHEAERPQDDE